MMWCDERGPAIGPALPSHTASREEEAGGKGLALRARARDPASQPFFAASRVAPRLAATTPRGKDARMNTPNIYRVRFTQNQRYALNISAPSAELAEFFAEEIRKRAGTASFEAIGDAFSDDWQSEEICSTITPDLLTAVANALDELRKGCPRWTIEENLANALARAKAQGNPS
jgi:hypothetical protein